MAVYSHSKLSTFQNCPYQYKLHYIDNIKPETPTTIEAFMGSLVHQTLEKLYTDKKYKKRVSKATLIKFYKDEWDKQYTKDIKIVKKLNSDNYKKMGIDCISKYYNKFKPFDQITILGVETQDMLTLPDGNKYHIRIDKLGFKGNNYYVCDYKTNSAMKTQEEADMDRQLAMYSVWVKDKFKDAKKVILKWHMLAFNKDVTSERTEEQLKVLQEEVMNIIRQIESEKEFPRNISSLCDYCGYKNTCPSFKHEVILEAKPAEQYQKDDGLQLVNKFVETKEKLKELEARESELKDKLIEFCKQLNVDIVYGSNMQAKVKEVDAIKTPEEDKQRGVFLQLIKDKGLFEDLATINHQRLQSRVLKGELTDEDVLKLIEIIKAFRITLSRRKEDEE